ncbi:MAG TPA: phosphotransferase [Blastocatellia bacterium]|nr:phosphotransferase [Blastocatellia bacterium]
MAATGLVPETSRPVHLALVHHANQYLITEGYADREGMRTILGLRQPGDAKSFQRGLLPLLQLHLKFRIPLNLHLSGTLMEALAWYYPESFSLVRRLQQAGLLELIGSAFSQNIMPYFSEQHNLHQLNEELWLLQKHLDCDLSAIRTFWVPERVWDTEKLSPVLRHPALLNGGYQYVLLDDRHVFPAGETYDGSARQRFDRGSRFEPDAFRAWRISNGNGLVMLPFSRKLRYLIPPSRFDSLRKLSDLLERLAALNDESVIAIYADDLEKAAGVGGWDPEHESRYERLLRWLRDNQWIRPVLLNEWAAGHAPAGEREIERGTFYELARQWNAGEDYRGWIEDPNCQAHRQYLEQAERALIAAEQRGADRGLLELGWKHLLHCSYETAWHSTQHSRRKGSESLPLEGWAAALSSHARSCLVIARAAEWFRKRDGQAHAELCDIDQDGETELVLKNDQLFAVISPERGGRLVYLFDLTGESGRLVIGNISDDWNLQEELNRYMDQPRNHPGALAEVGHEHDRYLAIIAQQHGAVADVILRNVEQASALGGAQKHIRLSAQAGQLCIRYIVPRDVWRLSTEFCLSPDYYKMLREGHEGIEALSGPDWKGRANGSAQVWVRLDRQQSMLWDKPFQNECGHGFNLRASSFSHTPHIEVGIGTPPAGSCGITDESSDSDANPLTDTHFMRRFLERRLAGIAGSGLKIQACNIRPLRIHHDRLTLQYDLTLRAPQSRVTRTLVGMWRADDRAELLRETLSALWEAGFDGRDGLLVPQPLAWSESLRLLLTEKARGSLLRQWICNPNARWVPALTRVADWLAKLHRTQSLVNRSLTPERIIEDLKQWQDELTASDEPWLRHERGRIGSLLAELMTRLRENAPDELCLIHGDFHAENILLRGSTVTVIDFEHCVTGDPANDPGYLIGQLDLQADRYWSRRGRRSPHDISRLAQIICAQYCRTQPESVLVRVPLYQARTYLKHLLYTLRMKGTEQPQQVTLWLDKVAACLAAGAVSKSQNANAA